MTETARGSTHSIARLLVLGHAMMAIVLFATNGGESLLGVLVLFAVLFVWGKALKDSMADGPASVEAAVEPAWVVALGSAVVPIALVRIRPPGIFLETGVMPFVVLDGLAVIVLATYAIDIRKQRALPWKLTATRRATLFGLALAIGAWTLRASPNPQIDVFPVHQQAAQALLAGKSIYQPGVIQTPSTMPFAPNELLDEYTYLPLGACLTTVAYALTHDSRWADLVAQLAGGALLWAIARRCTPVSAPGAERSPRTDAWPDLLAALLLFHPRGPFVLEQTWTESLALPFLGGFVFFALSRRPRSAAVCLGLLCAMKQHLVFYVPFLAFVPGIGVSGVVLAGAVAVATMLPFAIPSPYGFYRGPFAMLVHNPFRTDALNLPAELARIGVFLPTWVGFLAGLVPVALLRRTPKRLPVLLLASAVAFTLFYLFGRQAFCNYYYLLDATVLFAAATLSPSGHSAAGDDGHIARR
jgi:hypothetical protein